MMKRDQSSLLVFLLLVVVGMSSGCRGTLRMDSKRDLAKFDGGTEPVYVTNPEMQFEYDVLKASGIYQISPAPDAARRLTLRPIRRFARCGNPLMLTGITLGIIPSTLPGARIFEYGLESNGQVERRCHHLPLYERISIWENLAKHNDEKVLTEALAWSTLILLSAPSKEVPR